MTGFTPVAYASDALSLTIDTGGPDDEPSQADLNSMGFDTSHLGEANPFFSISINYDDTDYPGGNTGDACALLDGDKDGLADFAYCVQIGDPDADGDIDYLGTFLYDCKDTKDNRCFTSGGGGDGSNGIIAMHNPLDTNGDGIPDDAFTLIVQQNINGIPAGTLLQSMSSIIINDPSDPFAPDALPPSDPANMHGSTSVCRDSTGGINPPSCLATDTVVSADIFVNELIELDGDLPSEEVSLTNVCTFPSPQANSDDKDCVVNAGSGFIKVVKIVQEGDGDGTFTYTLDGQAFATITTTDEMGMTGSEPFPGGEDYTLLEQLPDETWGIVSASCDNGTISDTGDDTDILATNGVFTLSPGERETCTFVNEIIFIPAPNMTIDKVFTSNDDEDGSLDISVGDTLNYSITVKNEGNVPLTNVTISDPLLGTLICSPPQPTTLLPDPDGEEPFDNGESLVCSGTYVVQASDVTAGQIDNTATGRSFDFRDIEDSVTVPVPSPSLNITKSNTLHNDADSSGDVSVGDTIRYTYSVENTGTANLTSVAVSDDLLGAAVLSDLAGDGIGFLAVGDTETATLDYVVQASDLGTDIVNIATASSDQTPDDTDTNTVPVPSPSLAVDKAFVSKSDEDSSGTDSVGDILNYTITVTNDGTANLTNVTVDDDLTGTVDALCSAFLAPGASCSVDVMYDITQADLDAGQVDNIGTGDSDQTPPSDDPETVLLDQIADILADKVFAANDDADMDGFISTGDTLTYTITATNTGNVTLTDVTVDDDLTGTMDAFCAASLAPTASCSVDVQYVVLESDRGLLINTGTVTGQCTVEGCPVSDDDPEQVIVFGDVCENTKPKSLFLLYEGDNDSSHSQEGNEVIIEGDSMAVDPAFIIVEDHKGRTRHSDFVALGGIFEVSGSGEQRISPRHIFFIYDGDPEDGGLLKETVQFHTSCSQPLFIGDEYGSLTVIDSIE